MSDIVLDQLVSLNKSFNKYIVYNKSINDAKYQERCKKYNSEIETLKKDYSQQIEELEKNLLIAQKKGSSVQINKIKNRIQNDIKATSLNSEILNYFSDEDSDENYLAKLLTDIKQSCYDELNLKKSQDNIELKEKVKKMQNEVDKVTKEKEIIEEQNKELVEKEKKEKSEKEQLQKEKETIKNERDNLQKENEALRSEKYTLQQKIETLEKANQSLNTEKVLSANQSNNEAEINEYKQKIETLQFERNSLKQKIQILVEQYTLLEQKVIEEKNKNKSLEEENTTLKQKLTEEKEINHKLLNQSQFNLSLVSSFLEEFSSSETMIDK